ncbi:MAG: hypothetical protein R3B72_32800 [Polyangiaceae bacterium]
MDDDLYPVSLFGLRRALGALPPETLTPSRAARLDVDRDELARGPAEAGYRREHQLVALVSADRDPAGVPQQPLGRRPDHHHDTEHILSVAIAAKMPVSLTVASVTAHPRGADRLWASDGSICVRRLGLRSGDHRGLVGVVSIVNMQATPWAGIVVAMSLGCASTPPTGAVDEWLPTPTEVVLGCRRGPDGCVPVSRLPSPICGEPDPAYGWKVETRDDEGATSEAVSELASNDVRQCWDAAVRFCWPAAGRVQLNLVVAADGHVLSAVAGPSAGAAREYPRELGDCLVRAFGWRFQRSRSERRQFRMTLSFPPTRPRVSAEDASNAECNPGNTTILGTWARPHVHYVDAQGGLSPAPNWRADLWLPDDGHGHGCRFSCASSYLSAVLTAAGPATFVQLSHSTEGARRLRWRDATLSVAGAAPSPQTGMKNDRFAPYDADEHHQSYFLAFPPTNPPTWTYLEVMIPIDDSPDRLRVRFVRMPASD